MSSAPEHQVRRVRIALGVAAGLLLLFLIFGESPWSSGAWERLEWGQNVKPRDAMTFTWPAALANLALVGILFATARSWLRPADERDVGAFAARPARDAIARRVLVGMAMALLLLQAWPRMDHSLWTDEEYSARRSVVGAYEVDPDGSVEWERAPWRDTLWAYRQPNNHVPFSILSRITTRIAGTQRPEEGMEVAFRFPALAFGILGLAAIAALGTRLGAAWAGVVAALLLAGHPWYLRFASAGRGYSLMLLLLPVFWIAAWNVLQRPSWRRFAVFGSLQFLLMWSYPALFILVAITNGWMLVEWIRRRPEGAAVPPFVTRLVTTATLGAMLFVQLMIPNVIQLQGYLARKSVNFTPRWLWNLYSYLLAGAPYGHDERDPIYPTVSDLSAASPALVRMTAWLFVGVAVAGFVRLLVRGGPHLGFALVLVVVAPLTLGWAWATDSMLYQQYLLFGLTGLVLFVALGVGLPFELRPGRPSQAFGAAIAIAVGCLLIFIGQPSRRALIDRPIDAFRESVLATRASLDPADETNARVITTSISGCNEFYDPLCRSIASLADLESLIREADAEGKLLFVNYARPELLERRVPDQLAFVNRDDLFETVARFPGYQSHRTRIVRRYRAGSFGDSAPFSDPAAGGAEALRLP